MAGFSGVVKIADLNDFISPSQACVVGLGQNKAEEINIEQGKVQINSSSKSRVKTDLGSFPPTSASFDQVSLKQNTQSKKEEGPIKVTLHDCLACSGCVTSAETILLEQQSVDEFLQKLEHSKQVGREEYEVVVSLAPQSRTSLAAVHGLTQTETQIALENFFKSIGVSRVFDVSLGRNFSLLETAREFISRFKNANNNGKNIFTRNNNNVNNSNGNLNNINNYGSQNGNSYVNNHLNYNHSNLIGNLININNDIVNSKNIDFSSQHNNHDNKINNNNFINKLSTEETSFVQYHNNINDNFKNNQFQFIFDQTSTTSQNLPMLTSACPGWVCYAEKVHGDYILPYISTTKSPQAVMGTLVKNNFQFDGNQCLENKKNKKIYHCTVMPCYDKKLEASREDFRVQGSDSEQEIDCVLSTIELQELLDRFQIDLKTYAKNIQTNNNNGSQFQNNNLNVGNAQFFQNSLDQKDQIQIQNQKSEQKLLKNQFIEEKQQINIVDNESKILQVNQPEIQGSTESQNFESINQIADQQIENSQFQNIFYNQNNQNIQLFGYLGGSGGYLDFTYRVAAKELFGIDVPPGPLNMKRLRNVDMQEINLEVGGEIKLRFAKAYGFRNLQSLVRKIKNGTSPYDFVEVMACPGGCLNGGGQIKYREGSDPKQELQKLEELYHDKEIIFEDPRNNLQSSEVYSKLMEKSEGQTEILHTQYHKIDKLATNVIADW